MKYKLYNGDCLEIMSVLIESGVKVDCIITDLPYGTTACKWDAIIPFEPMWDKLNKLIKDNGAMVMFGQEPFSTKLRSSNMTMYKYDWIWEKEQGSNFPNAKNQPLKIHELISVFSKGNMVHKGQTKNRMEYYPQGLVISNKTKNLKKDRALDGNYLGSRKNQINKTFIQQFTNYPTTILKFNRERGLHPTQKPIPLLEYLIKTYTNENETVLDFTMGSGSTGVACLNTNRNFIGIELDKNYFNIAKNRIEEADKNGE